MELPISMYFYIYFIRSPSSDLKPANILLTTDPILQNCLVVRIADFGLSDIIRDETDSRSGGGFACSLIIHYLISLFVELPYILFDYIRNPYLLQHFTV